MKNIRLDHSQLGLGLLLFVMLGLGAAALSRGLGGSFLLDDYENLDGLESIAASTTPGAAERYILNGVSSPLGRPLALMTFVAQRSSWPGHPEDFLYVNALLHLLNACLVFWCLLRVLEFMPSRAPPSVALLATGLWLFAAPQLSAVLYTVQRMTELSGTFMLAGLLLYLAGRRREAAGLPRSGFALMAAGSGVAVGLGYLAKETAALFPLLVLVLEHTLLRDAPRSARWRLFAGAFLWLPTVVVLAHLSSFAWRYNPTDVLRPFTVGERLLTEPRVLFLYLRKALLPPLYGFHVYYDDIAASRSLWSPWTTAASIAAWSALVALAVRWRARAPMLAFAVLWFLGAHLLEATVIPLELAFDHRNYVALLGPALALAWYGQRLAAAPAVRRIRPAIVAGAAAYGVLIVGTFWQAAAFWSRPWEVAHFWAVQQPDSRRAQMVLPRFYWRLNLPEEAARADERSLERWPGDVSFFLSRIETSCAFKALPMPDLRRIPEIVSHFDASLTGTIGYLDVLVSDAEGGHCSRLTPAELWGIVQMVFDTPRLARFEQSRLILLSRIAAVANDRPLARELLDQSIRARTPSIELLKRAATFSLYAGDLACAQRYFDLYERTPFSPLRRWSYRPVFAELAEWRDRLAAAPANASQPRDASACPLNAASHEP